MVLSYQEIEIPRMHQHQCLPCRDLLELVNHVHPCGKRLVSKYNEISSLALLASRTR